MTLLKPYMLLACAAFMTGFLGYWLLGRALVAAEPGAGPVYEAPVSAAAPADDLAAGKRI
ncbi:MAG: hypothetical protein JNL41_14530 [Phenylobacterium sp.]|uniref:hypothetical protein n=1 Tax=Phenylobacterium sp. TaxID=1871053 RepID=UPI001A4A01F9|nr:hypothetical protein [Phenylobacterium sp.]MBL8555488.1 hypothetical protein [Phenylobacterium sp.]